MKRVVVTVKRKGEARVQDLELPADVPVCEWLDEMVDVLGWSSSGGDSYCVRAYGPRTPEKGVPVSDDSTLEAAGVRDGFWLVGEPRPSPSPTPEQASQKDPDEKDDLEVSWVKFATKTDGSSVSEAHPMEGDDSEPDWLSREVDDLGD
jgi:hypothetical protein